MSQSMPFANARPILMSATAPIPDAALRSATLDDDARRAALSDYARDQFGALDNKAQALVNVSAYAVHLAEGLPDASDVVIEDLKLVLVGLDYTPSGRNQGAFFVDPTLSILNGNTGFQTPFQQPDGLNQVSHAVAGIGLSYQASRETGDLIRTFLSDIVGPPAGQILGAVADRLAEGLFGRAFGELAEHLVERVLLLQESEPWDDNLYLAGFEVADQLTGDNIGALPALIAGLIGDETVSTDLIPPFPEPADATGDVAVETALTGVDTGEDAFHFVFDGARNSETTEDQTGTGADRGDGLWQIGDLIAKGWPMPDALSSGGWPPDHEAIAGFGTGAEPGDLFGLFA